MRDFLRLNVDAVITDWGEFEPTGDEIDAILEIAYLAIASDGVVTRSEVEAFATVMERLFGPELTAEHIEEVLDQYEDSLDRTGFRSRIEVLAARLKRTEVAEKGYQLAYAMVMCDLDTNVHEFEFAMELLRQLKIDEERGEELVDGVVDLVIEQQAKQPPSA